MAKENVERAHRQGNLFLPVSDVMLAEVIDAARELGFRFPEILRQIAADQDRLGLEKKRLRVEHRAWVREQTAPLPGMQHIGSREIVAGELQPGRPRMDPESVLVFLSIAHYFNSIYCGTAVERLLDSLSVYRFLGEKAMKMPGLRTIGDNVNAVSLDTRRHILQCQAQLVLSEELDDLREVCGDSTSCEANTRWPTDSGLIYRLLSRLFRDSQKLEVFALPTFRVHWMNQWLRKLKDLDFAINVANNSRARRKLYRRYLKTAANAVWHLGEEALRLHDTVLAAALPPVLHHRLRRHWGRMLNDIQQVCHIYQQCEARVLNGQRVKGSDRILSVSDRTAAYIIKGDRCAVVGYKPQLARSRNGLITALLVPQGNAADSAMLVPLVAEAIEITGVVPHLGSFDDGYSSGAGLKDLKDLGVQDVSFSGSKGKAVLGDAQWDSSVLKEARRYRSAVESLIFCLKHSHEFGELRRRGIEAVREELTGKAIVYNFCRIIVLRKRKRRATDQPKAA
jgi:hypothetical protein